MKLTPRLLLRLALWSILGLVLIVAGWLGYLSLRYSPEYMVRDVFRDLGTVYDYRFFPERQLAPSPRPFTFQADTSQEVLVQDAFSSILDSTDLDSFLEKTRTQAFLVIRDDALIYERYFLGFQRDSLVTSYSIAKSFDSALVGIAIQEGYIKSAEDPITDYIPELTQRDPRFQDIQVRHLLMMSSGLRYEPDRFASLGDDALTYTFDDLRHLALTETQVVEPPGVTMLYNNYNPLLLGLILERATGRSVTSYLQEKIWDRTGMEYPASWSLDSQESGFEKMESGINARAIDFAKLGRLYLNGGSWDGEQVVPAGWVRLSTQDNGLIPQADPVSYGYMWWGLRCNPQDFFALGDHGQFVYVSPAKKLIIVRNGEEYGLPGEFLPWAQTFCRLAKALP